MPDPTSPQCVEPPRPGPDQPGAPNCDEEGNPPGCIPIPIPEPHVPDTLDPFVDQNPCDDPTGLSCPFYEKSYRTYPIMISGSTLSTCVVLEADGMDVELVSDDLSPS